MLYGNPSQPLPDPAVGDLFVANLGMLYKVRPVLVLEHFGGGTCIVAKLTTSEREDNVCYLHQGEGGLNGAGFISRNRFGICRDHLRRRLGAVGSDVMRWVEEAEMDEVVWL